LAAGEKFMSDNSDHTAIPLRIAELLCSRLCHDLISPVAAVSNGLELLGEDMDDMAGEITSLLSFSVGQAAGWLMFFRVAYGLGGENADALSLTEAGKLIRGIVEEDKIILDLQEGDVPLGRDSAKVLLNATLVGLETLPNRGNLKLTVDQGPSTKITVATHGDGVALRPEVREVLQKDYDISGLSARTVQGYFTSWLAGAVGGSFGLQAEEASRIVFSGEIPSAK
jgi:histidine phosphotransferase ChpT